MNSGFEYQERVGRAGDGMTVLGYLSHRYQHSSPARWRGRIDSGQVFLDGCEAGPSVILQEGQFLCWRRRPWQEAEAPLFFDVLHRDESVLAVAKPAGLPTLPGGGFLDHTLLALVREKNAEASPLHRLGRWTSGIVLFALKPGARSALSEAWRSRRVEKEYRALASGYPAEEKFTVTAPIGPVPHAILGSVHGSSKRGKAARSHFTVLERREDRFLASVAIETGRPHQIRIHAGAAGHPLVGDPLYGPGGLPREGGKALPGDPGYHLHAARLRFPHPSGHVVDLWCPPPPLLRGPGH